VSVSYWDAIGPSKDFAHPINVDRLLEFVPRDARVIDYGCGYGRGVHALIEAGYTSVLGVDPAIRMIAAANVRVPGGAFEHLANPPHVPRPAGSFDAALLTAVLTCVPPDEDQCAILDELTRLLGPRGLLHIADFWLQSDARNLERYARARPEGAPHGTFTLPEGVTVRHHSRKHIASLTQAYQQLALDETVVRTMNGHEARGFHWYGRKR
jgi:SAM-dependent methyltransferase